MNISFTPLQGVLGSNSRNINRTSRGYAIASPLREDTVCFTSFKDNTGLLEIEKKADAREVLNSKDYKKKNYKGISNVIFDSALDIRGSFELGDNVKVLGTIDSDVGFVKAGNNIEASAVYAKKDITIGDNAKIKYIGSYLGDVKLGENADVRHVFGLKNRLEIKSIKDVDVIEFVENDRDNKREFVLHSENGRDTIVCMPEFTNLTIKTPSGNRDILETFEFRKFADISIDADVEMVGDDGAVPMSQRDLELFVKVEKL